MRGCEREEFLQRMKFSFLSFVFLVPRMHYLLYVKTQQFFFFLPE